MPAEKIIANAYNLTLASLGLLEPQKTEHGGPEEILESVAAKEKRNLAEVDEIEGLL